VSEQSPETSEKRRQSALAYWASERSAEQRAGLIERNRARRKRPRQKEVPMSWAEVYQVRPRDPNVAMAERIQRWASGDFTW
jgi:hypothetical protein